MPSLHGTRTIIDQIGQALARVLAARDEVAAQVPSPGRSLRLADLATEEAACWEALSERSGRRVLWLAALGAREHALDLARRWRHDAAAQLAAEPTISIGAESAVA